MCIRGLSSREGQRQGRASCDAFSGSVQDISFLQRSLQGEGAGARHTYSITEAGTDDPVLR